MKEHNPRVDRDLCVGCGVCVENCPQGAIDLVRGIAVINPERCVSCGQCISVCPRGAIRETVTASELRQEVQAMGRQIDDILDRLARMA
jgi:ferredoxin